MLPTPTCSAPPDAMTPPPRREGRPELLWPPAPEMPQGCLVRGAASSWTKILLCFRGSRFYKTSKGGKKPTLKCRKVFPRLSGRSRSAPDGPDALRCGSAVHGNQPLIRLRRGGVPERAFPGLRWGLGAQAGRPGPRLEAALRFCDSRSGARQRFFKGRMKPGRNQIH